MNLRTTLHTLRRIGPVAAGVGLLWAAAAGCNNSTPESLSGMIAATPATTSGDFARPFDTVPSSDGSTFYFTGMGSQGLGVYSVPAMGGAAMPLAVGTPFVSPFGIAISSDDKTLYIADAAAGYDPNDPAGSDNLGLVYTLPVGGGMPQPLMGTAGTRPRSIDVASNNGADTVWFTGNTSTGDGAVYNIPASGGTPTTAVSGAPLVDPSGIALSKSGDAYVVNTTAPDSGAAAIYKISGGMATPYVSGIQVGYPAGAALSMGETVLLISGRDGNAGTDVVYTVKLDGSMALGSVNMGIEGNTDAAGLHRARNSNVFSWADLTAGPTGTGIVYRIELK
jgi:sugar lactone lactonase YvrE